MSFTLVETFPRLWSLEAGTAMVVTDLHGDWDVYQRYRDQFVLLQGKGQVDCLIFTGDLIHSESDSRPDQSIEIVQDVLALQAFYGAAVIYMCGNHEMPHIYSIGLARGSKEYTPTFEAALTQSGRRDEIIPLFESLPFYVRTRAGVSLAHSGAFSAITKPDEAQRIFNWSHKELLGQADRSLEYQDLTSLRHAYARLNVADSYQSLAERYLAISDPDDPRYDHLLRGVLATSSRSFELLWSALFSRCEEEYGRRDYAIFLDAMLKEFSLGFYPQEYLITGHMNTRRGHEIVARRQLRLASARHAQPHDSGEYLLFDAARPIRSVKELLEGLGSVY